MTKITADTACKDALVALFRHSAFTQATRLPLPPQPPLSGPPNQVWAGAWISPHDLDDPIEAFVYRYIDPLMADLARRIPRGPIFEPIDLEIPKGVLSAKCHTYRGAHMRAVIAHHPITPGTDPRVWRSFQHFYDMEEDGFVWCDVGLAIRFDLRLAA